MAEDEEKPKSYVFIRPGALQSRILNRERQSALGRGLGVLLSTMGPKPQESEQSRPPLPRLELSREEAPPQETAEPESGVKHTALLSRLQGVHRAESGQGFGALFRAINANSEAASTGMAARTIPQSPATISPGAAADPPIGGDPMVAVAGGQFPLASDFTVVMMDVNLIQPNPFVPLSHIDREGLDRLMESIKAHGFLRPLVVMPSTLGNVMGGQTYWLVSGERSWQIARLMGIERVPVRVHDVAPREAIQIVLADDWHIQRLPSLDRSHLIEVLTDQMGMNVGSVAERLAISVQEVEDTLALLKLEPEIQDSLNYGEITEAAAQELTRINDPEMRSEIWSYAVRYHWGPNRIQRALRERLEREDASQPSGT